MLAISLTSILEQVAARQTGRKNLSGNIKDFRALLGRDNLELLEASVNGFAYMAFHPGVDVAMREYILEGTLASDSGPKLLALFTLGEQATWPRPVRERSFGAWLDVDITIHPGYRMVEWLFAPKAPPPLPGVALFDSLLGEREVVYVPLGAAADAGVVRQQLRSVFSHATASLGKNNFSDRLGAALRRERTEYVKSGRTSPREALVSAYQVADEHLADIVAVAGLAVGA
jgi:hypothetical protein